MRTSINYINSMGVRVTAVALAAGAMGFIKSELALRTQSNLDQAEVICQRHQIDNDNYASGWEMCYLIDHEWAEVLRTRESEVVAAEEKQAAKERSLIESYRK